MRIESSWLKSILDQYIFETLPIAKIELINKIISMVVFNIDFLWISKSVHISNILTDGFYKLTKYSQKIKYAHDTEILAL